MKAQAIKGERIAPGRDFPGAGDALKIAATVQNTVPLHDLPQHAQIRVRAALMNRDRRVSMLLLAQIERAFGCMNHDAAFYLIGWAVEKLASDRVETDWALARINQEIEAVEKREGLQEDEVFPLADPETPEHYQALAGQWWRRFEEIQAAILREYSEADMAALLLTDPDAYRRRALKGLEGYRRMM